MMGRARSLEALLVVLTLAGCGDMWGDLTGTKRGATEYGADGCPKVAATIQAVMTEHPSCSATAPCPCGTFCTSPTDQGVCTAECADDSWCLTGFKCSIYGECLPVSAPDGGVSTADPACPRDNTRLDEIKMPSKLVSCEFDEVCPYGAFCDQSRGVCDWICRTDATCAAMAAPGQTLVCTCSGKCVEPSKPRVTNSTPLPTLETTPTSFQFVQPASTTTPNWGVENTRSVAVRIRTPSLIKDAAGAVVGPNAKVWVNPGPNTIVSCAGGAESTSPCLLNIAASTFFRRQGEDGYRAETAIVVKPVMSSTDVTSWEVKLTSADVANAPLSVVLGYSGPALAGAAPMASDLPPDGFTGRGTVTLRTPTGSDLQVPVIALSDGYTLKLYDESHVLSPGGFLFINPTPFEQLWLDTLHDDKALAQSLDGGMGLGIQDAHFVRDQARSTLTGDFTMVMRNHGANCSDPGDDSCAYNRLQDLAKIFVPATFFLNDVAPAKMPLCDNGCAAGSSCELGVCVIGPQRDDAEDFVIWNSRPDIHNKRMNVWKGYTWVDGGLTTIAEPVWRVYAPSVAFVRNMEDNPGTVTFPWPPFNNSGDVPINVQLGDPVTGQFFSRLKPLAVPLITDRDGGDASTTAGDLLQACLADLQRSPPGDWEGFGYTTAWDEKRKCFDYLRFGKGLQTFSLSQRLYQEWITLHGFLGREALEEIRLNDVESASGVVGISSGAGNVPLKPELTQIMSLLEGGLGFLLDSGPLFGTGNFTAESLAQPDYRGPFFMGTRSCTTERQCNNADDQTMDCVAGTCTVRSLAAMPQHEQPLGLPVPMVELVSTYFNVVNAHLEDVARRNYGAPGPGGLGGERSTALTRYGQAMRLGMALEARANVLRARTLTVTCETSDVTCANNKQLVTKRWEAAVGELDVSRRRLAGTATTLAEGLNPLGIADDEIPLFFGDPSGTNSRYFASSDYLLNGWADPAVKSAQGALSVARDAWLAKRAEYVQDEAARHNRDRELNDIKTKYGSVILSNCGKIMTTGSGGEPRQLESNEALEYFDKHKLDNETCFIAPECIGTQGVDGATALETAFRYAFLSEFGDFVVDDKGTTVASGTMRTELCKINQATGLNLNFHATNAAQLFAEQLAVVCPWEIGFQYWLGPYTFPMQSCNVSLEDDGQFYVSSNNPTWSNGAKMPLTAIRRKMSLDEIEGPTAKYRHVVFAPAGMQLAKLTQHEFIATRGFQKMSDPKNVFGYVDVRDVHSSADLDRLEKSFRWCTLGSSPSLDRDRPMPDIHDLPPSCYSGQLGTSWYDMQVSRLRVRRAQETLNATKANVEDLYKTCKNIDDAIKKIDTESNSWISKISKAVSTVSTIAGGVAAAYTGDIKGVLSSAQGLLNLAAAQNQENVANLEKHFSHSVTQENCWNNWRANQRSITGAITDIQIATAEMKRELVAVENQRNANDLALQEGLAVLKREQDSPLSTLSHPHWLDEKVERFKKELDWSRRLTFLAMRAVEYELQESLPFRAQILSAVHPDQLEDVVRSLKQEQASRTINRRRPEEASIVLSLRDDVLHVLDRSGETAPGERNWTPAQRFKGRLLDERYAVRNKKGEYLGQGVPFNLGVTGILETRCGERLWRATATVQGDGVSDSSPGTSVLLLKRNTFSSQYCAGKGGDQEFQSGAIRPSAQLFRPGAEINLSEADDYTAAQLFPWFNVRRSDFYKTSYRDGASEELAGRGLYGDYVLLFPKQYLNEGGIELDRVEDVLLRLDYLSVDNLSQ